jgi:hypothetical protein
MTNTQKRRVPEITTNAAEADAIVCMKLADIDIRRAVPPTGYGLCFRCGVPVLFHALPDRVDKLKICVPCITKEIERGLN